MCFARLAERLQLAMMVSRRCEENRRPLAYICSTFAVLVAARELHVSEGRGREATAYRQASDVCAHHARHPGRIIMRSVVIYEQVVVAGQCDGHLSPSRRPLR
jgi:hypothetical protein